MSKYNFISRTSTQASITPSETEKSAYEHFVLIVRRIINYIIWFVVRLIKDLYYTGVRYFFGDSVLADHVVKLYDYHRRFLRDRVVDRRASYRRIFVIKQSSIEKVPSEPAKMTFFRRSQGTFASVSVGILEEAANDDERDLLDALYLIHIDTEFLAAADAGNCELLDILINQGADIQQKDHLGRNALHLAVCADNEDAVILLINAGVETSVKDNLGATPLSLSLMRRPSLRVAQLLFQYGAKILPRAKPTDTGLFQQFVMMCKPTAEEAQILQLLVEKGAKINDKGAPGGRQALHFAAMSNNCILIRLLVDLGADLFLMNHRKQTPRDVAFIFTCTEAYELLTEMEESASISDSEPSKTHINQIIIADVGAPM